ncbi:MAG: type II secretion system protein GspD, partial [Chthoniobacteraceae bacterium]
SIIVVGNKEDTSKVFPIIDEVDLRQTEVIPRTVIGELTLGSNETFSVDYILRNGPARVVLPISPGTNPGTGNGGTGNGGTGNNGGNVGAGTGFVSLNGNSPVLNFNNLINQQTVNRIGVAGATGLSGFFTVGNTLDVIVNALESTNRFRVTQRPSLNATNNSPAKIISGQEIAIPTNIQSSFNTGNNLVTNSSVQFKRVALELTILPLINSEKEVSLDILQRVDEVSGSTRIDNNDIPTVATREIETRVTVPNNGTLVLGGLVRDNETNTRSGVPYLSRIPVVGALFRSTSKVKQRTELVILIRPVVTLDNSEAVEQRERQFESLDLEADLESSLAPPNTRKRAPFDDLLRRSQMILRQESEILQEASTARGLKK